MIAGAAPEGAPDWTGLVIRQVWQPDFGAGQTGQNGTVAITVRPLEHADAEQARRLGGEAFGVPTSPPTQEARVDQPGVAWFGAFDDGVLVARMVDRVYDSCFGGVLVPTSGIAGVTVVAEARGRGTLSPLFAATLASARRRGAVLSTLFPTAPGIYRRFGYEVVADYVRVELPTTALTAVRAPIGTTTRRATLDDVEAIRGVYDHWAIAQNGPLSRRGVSFPGSAKELLSEFTGVTVAVDADGEVVGFVSWNRGQGYGESAAIEVADLLAGTADGYAALLRLVGSFASVAPATRIDTSGDDLARLHLPSLSWRITSSSPYMLKVLDVVGALTARHYPPSLSAELTLTLAGDVLPDLDGGYRLTVAGGRAQCVREGAERLDAGDRVLTPRGLALLYAGAQSSANLRAAGHLIGGDVAEDLDWDALFGGRQAHIRDYF